MSKTGRRVRIYESVSELPSATRMLAQRAEQSAFCLGLDWYEVFEANVAKSSGRRLLLSAEDEIGRALAMLPLWAPIARTSRPLALTGLANYYTPVFQPWVSANSEAACIGMSMIAEELCRYQAWSRITLNPIDALHPAWRCLREEMHRHGMYSFIDTATANWTTSVAGMTCQDYIQQRTSRLRNTIKRRSKKIARYSTTNFQLIDSKQGLESGLDAYERVYGKSWKRSEAYPSFVRELAAMCARRGWLRLGIMFVNGRPAAVQFWIVANGVASIFKLAYDPAFEEFSVGTLLMVRMLECVIDVDRVHSIDFLTGDDAFKADWMSKRTERQALLILAPWTVDGFAGLARKKLKLLLERFG